MARVHGAEMKRRSSHELSGLNPGCISNLRFSFMGRIIGEVRRAAGRRHV